METLRHLYAADPHDVSQPRRDWCTVLKLVKALETAINAAPHIPNSADRTGATAAATTATVTAAAVTTTAPSTSPDGIVATTAGAPSGIGGASSGTSDVPQVALTSIPGTALDVALAVLNNDATADVRVLDWLPEFGCAALAHRGQYESDSWQVGVSPQCTLPAAMMFTVSLYLLHT
jgi:hypothetical protein